MKSSITTSKSIARKRASSNKNTLKTIKSKVTVKNERTKIPTPSLPEGWPVSTSNPFLSNTTSNKTSEINTNFLVKSLSSPPASNRNKKCKSNEDQPSEDDASSYSSCLRLSDIYEHRTEGEKLGLAPGTMLQKCTGEDIQLSKNSDARPNFAVGRGRFLFVLPGMLSLRQPTSPVSTAVNLKNKNNIEDTLLDGSGLDNSIDSEAIQSKIIHDSTLKQDLPSEKLATKFTASSTTSPVPASTLQSLGKIKNLKTSNPTLIIPLPNGQNLTFKGRKLECSSRFLVLTCRSSGKVLCRDVFQEIVAFGDVNIEPYFDVHAVASETMLASTISDEAKDTKEIEKKSKIDIDDKIVNKEENQENKCKSYMQLNSHGRIFHHYGGSERTVDGGKCLKLSKANCREGGGIGAKKKKSVAAVLFSSPGKKTTTPSKEKELSVGTRKKHGMDDGEDDSHVGSDNGDAESSSAFIIESKKRRKRKKYESDEDSEENKSSCDSDDDEEDYVSHTKREMLTPSQLPRKRSARLSSSTKVVKYSFQSDDDSVDEEHSASNSDAEDSVIDDKDAHSNSSECYVLHDVSTTKEMSRPKRTSCRKSTSTGCGEKSEKVNSSSSTIDLTNTDKVISNTKHSSPKNTTKNRMNKNEGENGDKDVVVIKETPTPTRTRTKRNSKSPNSAEFSYRRRRKSNLSPSAAVTSRPAKRCLADVLETGFTDDEFQFLNK